MNRLLFLAGVCWSQSTVSLAFSSSLVRLPSSRRRAVTTLIRRNMNTGNFPENNNQKESVTSVQSNQRRPCRCSSIRWNPLLIACSRMNPWSSMIMAWKVSPKGPGRHPKKPSREGHRWPTMVALHLCAGACPPSEIGATPKAST